MAAQFSDLYLRVQGLDLHAVSLALAHGQDPASLPRAAPCAATAASFVYRVFDAQTPVTMPDAAACQALAQAFPDALLFPFPKPRGSMARDFKWLGSYRYGILHLGGSSTADLHQRCAAASALLGWPAPYADRWAAAPEQHATTPAAHAAAYPATHPASPGLSVAGPACAAPSHHA